MEILRVKPLIKSEGWNRLVVSVGGSDAYFVHAVLQHLAPQIDWALDHLLGEVLIFCDLYDPDNEGPADAYEVDLEGFTTGIAKELARYREAVARGTFYGLPLP